MWKAISLTTYLPKSGENSAHVHTQSPSLIEILVSVQGKVEDAVDEVGHGQVEDEQRGSVALTAKSKS